MPGPLAFCPTKVRLASVSNVKPSARGVGVAAGDALAAGDTVAVGVALGVGAESLPCIACTAPEGELDGTGDETAVMVGLGSALSAVVVRAKTTSSEPSVVRTKSLDFNASLRDKRQIRVAWISRRRVSS
jgi:hypothetical protein